MQNVITL